MEVKLITYTKEPEKVVAMAGKLCYSKVGIEELEKNLSDEKIKDFIIKLKSMGHLSPFEHANFTFAIEGISRACSHQLVRHRTGSYSQQSQRYVENKNAVFVIPPSMQGEVMKEYIENLNSIQKNYNNITEELYKTHLNDMILSGVDEVVASPIARKLAIEDARYILPNASCTKIIVTMDARNLLHFFEQRCCNRAQWEIRELAKKMLKLVKEIAPNIFNNTGAPCNNCPEGQMSCKKGGKKNV